MSKMDDALLTQSQDAMQGLIERLRAAEVQAKQAKEDWQPIETAPKVQRQEVLIFSKDGIDIAIWDGEKWTSRGSRGEEFLDIDTPTHWMPLPASPST